MNSEESKARRVCRDNWFVQFSIVHFALKSSKKRSKEKTKEKNNHISEVNSQSQVSLVSFYVFNE